MHVKDRAEFEPLLTELQNATLDLIRAKNREHDAMHAVLNWVDRYRASAVVEPSVGPTTQRPFTSEELEKGCLHYTYYAPVDCCQCGTCCEVRAARVPTGTRPVEIRQNPLAPIPADEISIASHTREVAPVSGCACYECCEARTLAGVGKDGPVIEIVEAERPD